MTTLELHPQNLSIAGENFVLLPRKEFERVREMMDDVEDLIALEEAKASEGNAPRIPWEKIKEEFGLE